MPNDDPLIPLIEYLKTLPGSRGAKHVSPATGIRWIHRGCPDRGGNRVRLKATRCGGRWLIRQSDADAFFAALAADPAPTDAPPSRTPAQQARAADRASRELEKLGA